MFMNSYRKLARKTQREDGFSIIEVLIVMAILAILTVVIAGAIVLLRSSSTRLTTTTTSQNELNVAMTTLQRDISQSTGVDYGGQTAVATIWTGRNNARYKTGAAGG